MINNLQNYTKRQILALLKEQQKVIAETKALLSKKEEKLLQTAAQKDSLEQEAIDLKNEVNWLRCQLADLRRDKFGQRRERFTNAPENLPQLPFKIDEEAEKEVIEQTVQTITYERKKNEGKDAKKAHKGRKPLPEHLPVEEVKIYPEGDLTDMVCIGQEVTDELEYQPARFYIKRYIRYKYAPKNKEGVMIGALTDRIIPKGIIGSGLLASILVDKYMDHLPLYRIRGRFKREKIPIPSSTLEGWVKQGIMTIDILYQHLVKHIKSLGYLQADETTIKVLESGKNGKCHLGYYWVYNSPIENVTLFDYQKSRSIASGLNILEGFKGYLQTDGYGGYDKIGKQEGVVHLFCWAHARREFERALQTDKKKAEIALTYIQILYAVEAEARSANMTPEQRKSLRLKKSLPTIEAFAKWLDAEVSTNMLLPKSQLGKAIKYVLARWNGLQTYLYDGSLEIDNNLVENAIRPVALGRKNYLFAGSHDAAQRAACIYSFFAICKRHNVNPYEWLKFVFDNLNETKVNKLHELYPQNFKQKSNM